MTLLPCVSCNRHVFPGERRCPFCDGELPQRAVPSRRGRLARAGLALAVAATVGIAGCGGDSVPIAQNDLSSSDLAVAPDLGSTDLSHHTCYGAPPARA
jgi:hypothetical protein